MFTLKRISGPDAIPRAHQKAERYRLLNEPEEAESICLDILAIDPEHQQARVTLLLALTEQFRTHGGAEGSFARAQAVLADLKGEYERHYFGGLIAERRGHAQLDRGGPGSGSRAYVWLKEAMDCYEKAEAIRPAGNDDAILRWNTCARIIMKYDLKPPADNDEPILQE